MTAKFSLQDDQAISATISAGKKILGHLKGLPKNLSAEAYEPLEMLIGALPTNMEYEELLRINALVANARRSIGSGEASYQLGLVIRRLQHKRDICM